MTRTLAELGYDLNALRDVRDDSRSGCVAHTDAAVVYRCNSLTSLIVSRLMNRIDIVDFYFYFYFCFYLTSQEEANNLSLKPWLVQTNE